MRASIAVLSLSIFLGAAVSSAQNAPQAAPQNPPIDYSAVNCSGFVTDQKVPDGIQIVSGSNRTTRSSFRGASMCTSIGARTRVFASAIGSRWCGRTRIRRMCHGSSGRRSS